jgi:hypothetical protein
MARVTIILSASSSKSKSSTSKNNCALGLQDELIYEIGAIFFMSK